MKYQIMTSDGQCIMFEGTKTEVVREWMSQYHDTIDSLDHIIIDETGNLYEVDPIFMDLEFIY